MEQHKNTAPAHNATTGKPKTVAPPKAPAQDDVRERILRDKEYQKTRSAEIWEGTKGTVFATLGFGTFVYGVNTIGGLIAAGTLFGAAALAPLLALAVGVFCIYKSTQIRTDADFSQTATKNKLAAKQIAEAIEKTGLGQSKNVPVIAVSQNQQGGAVFPANEAEQPTTTKSFVQTEMNRREAAAASIESRAI